MDKQSSNRTQGALLQLEALTQLAKAYETLSHLHHAIACHIQRLALYKEQEDRANEIGSQFIEQAALESLGDAASYLNQLQRATQLYTQSLTLARTLGNRLDEGRLLEKSGLLLAARR